MTDAASPNPEGVPPHPLKVWLARPAGLTWELLCVLALFAIPASLAIGVFGENLRRLFGSGDACRCAMTDFDAHSKRRLETFDAGHAEQSGAGAASAGHTHTH